MRFTRFKLRIKWAPRGAEPWGGAKGPASQAGAGGPAVAGDGTRASGWVGACVPLSLRRVRVQRSAADSRRVTGDVLFGVYRGGREGWGSRGRNGVSDAAAWLPLPAEVAPGRARPPWSPAEGWASPAISPGRVTVLGARPAAHAAQRLGGRGRVWPSAGDIGDGRRRLCARPPAPAPATRPATAQDRRDQERARGSGRGQPGGHARGQAGGQARGQPGGQAGGHAGVSPGSGRGSALAQRPRQPTCPSRPHTSGSAS